MKAPRQNQESAATANGPSGRDPERLLDSMAALFKECGIYAAGHPRVLERARTFAAETDTWIEPPNWLAVRIRGDAFVVQKLAVAGKSPLAQWLLVRLRDAGLAGLEFGSKLDPESAIECARVLATCNARSGRTFGAAWPENHARIRPLELVFSGRHGADGAAPSEADSHGQGDGAGVAGTAAQDVWKLDLVARLARQDAVIERLRSIERIAEQTAGDLQLGQEGTASIDLVGSIVDLLPVEVARDPARVDQVVGEVLDAMQQSIARMLREGREVSDADLLRAALNVARKYFGKTAAPAAGPGELPVGRPEDDRIAPDLGLLLDEVAALPQGLVRLPTAAECEPTAPQLARELCGVYLHVLQHTERTESLAALAGCLPAALTAIRDDAVPMLDHYLRSQKHGFTEPAIDRARVKTIGFLDEIGFGALVCDHDYVDAGLVARSFPESLPVFARLLGKTPAGLELLRHALTVVGEVRLCRGAEVLRAAGSLDTRTVQALVALGGPLVLPLVQRALPTEDSQLRTAVLGYLRTLELPQAEGAALRFVEPPTELPMRYVEDLLRLAAGREAGDQRLRQQSSMLLRAFVLDPRRRLERRLSAMAGLRHLPGPETKAALLRLATEGRFTRFGKGPRALRQRAREVLQWLERRGS